MKAIKLAVARGVLDAGGLGLDRDAALALEVHGVEQLRAVVARVYGAGDLEDAIGQGRLPMVDVGDDREVPDVRCGRRHAAFEYGDPCALGRAERFGPRIPCETDGRT